MNHTQHDSNINTKIFIAIIVTAIGIFANVIMIYYQSSQNLKLEVLRLESNLILSAVLGADQDTAKDNLRFLSKLGLINKTKGNIKILLDEPKDQTPFSFKGTANLENYDKINDIGFFQKKSQYLKVIRYFNNEIDDKSADEIYWWITMIGELYPSVDARLVMAIFAVDSSFKPKAESQNGARGLGQLTPEICNEFNIKDPFDIKENIRGTYMFLDKSFNKWKNEKYFLDLVIAAKCAGSDTVEKYNDIPPDEETQDYVRKVINLYEQLIFLEEKEEKLRGKTRYFNEEK
jgi:hypothetical protein